MVTLVDGKLERVISRTLARTSRQTSVPWLQLRGIDGGGAYACLQQYGVDACLLQAVEDVAHLLLLLLYGPCRLGVAVGPVKSADRGEPYRSHLMLGLRPTKRCCLCLGCD